MKRIGAEIVLIETAELVENPWDNEMTRDWENSTKEWVQFCSVQPFPLAERLSFEMNIDRDYTRSSIRVYAPAGTKVEHHSRVVWLGRTYNVFGHPGYWNDIKGKPHHVAFVARLEDG